MGKKCDHITGNEGYRLNNKKEITNGAKACYVMAREAKKLYYEPDRIYYEALHKYEPYRPCGNACNAGKCQDDPTHTIAFGAFRAFVYDNLTTPEKRKLYGLYRRTSVFKRWLRRKKEMGLVCYYCDKALSGDKDFHVDHFIPLHLNGRNTVNNMVISCPRCNLSKSALKPTEYLTRIGKSAKYTGKSEHKPIPVDRISF